VRPRGTRQSSSPAASGARAVAPRSSCTSSMKSFGARMPEAAAHSSKESAELLPAASAASAGARGVTRAAAAACPRGAVRPNGAARSESIPGSPRSMHSRRVGEAA